MLLGEALTSLMQGIHETVVEIVQGEWAGIIIPEEFCQLGGCFVVVVKLLLVSKMLSLKD